MVAKVLVRGLLGFGLFGVLANSGARLVNSFGEAESSHFENSAIALLLGYERYRGTRDEICLSDDAETLYVQNMFTHSESSSPSFPNDPIVKMIAYSVSPKVEAKAAFVMMGLGGLLYVRNKRK